MMEPLLLPGRGRRDRRGMSGEDDAGGSESAVRGAEASVDRPRGGDAFALGESTAERVGARGDRGQCAGTASDHGKRPGAGGSAGDPGSGGAGEDADANGELGAGDREIVRIPDAEVFGGKICAVEEPGAGGGKGESGADDGSAGRGAKENRGIRPAGGETGQGEISGDH